MTERTNPESLFIRGSVHIDLPLPKRDHRNDLVGYELERTYIPNLLKTQPVYNPFMEATGYYFDVEEFKKLIHFVIQECCFPEGVNTGDPFIPELWQWCVYANMFCWKSEETDRRRYREVFVLVPRKNGKLITLNEKIPTPSGFSTMGELSVGDVVFDKDGKQCNVVWTSDVQTPEKAYRITFSNGDQVEACSDHQWHMYSRKQHPKYFVNDKWTTNRGMGVKADNKYSGMRGIYEDVWTTEEMFNAGVDSPNGKTFFVKMHSGIECSEKQLPIDPYLLGSWLGDGTEHTCHLTVGKQDMEQWKSRRHVESKPGVYRVWLEELSVRTLRKNNLYANKHIPEEYFTASREQRLALLQGLMDTDGTISKRGTDISIIQLRKQLAYDIVRLCYSLGLKATIKQVKKHSQLGTEGTYYHIQFSAGRNEHEVFRLKRKLDRMKPDRGRGRSLHIVSIEPCEPTPMRCIQVDSPSGTYLFSDHYLPTHNTTALGAIPTLYMFYCDPEKRAQGYCCAADTEQASVNFRHASYMIEQNPRLASRLRNGKVNRSTRSWEHNDGTTFKVLSSVAETKHGLSPSFVYIDEIHAHPDSELIDVMITGTAARRQPLIIYTTTADYDRPSVCNDLYDRAKAICNGIQTDPTFYPVIYEAQLSDNWEDERVWKKANPNYGKSIYPEHFDQMVRTAKNNPSQLNKFLRLHLNIRTKTETAWIPPHVWATGNAPESTTLLSISEIRSWLHAHRTWHSIADSPQWLTSHSIDLYIERYRQYLSWYIQKVEELRNEECYGGYDNTATRDIAALSLWFPSKGVNLFWGWCPAESIYRRTIEDNVPYNMWYEAGILNHTPQETISEKSIVQALIGDKIQQGILHYFRGLMSVAYDRWGSTFVYESLNDAGIVARPYPQSFAGMNQPCKQMESLLANRDYFHGGNPVLEWMIGNVVVRESPDGLIRPDKSKSSDKIDGIVSSLMALGNHLYPEIQVIDELAGLKRTEDRH